MKTISSGTSISFHLNKSNTTYAKMKENIDWLKQFEKEQKERSERDISFLSEALFFNNWRDQYKVWCKYFWVGEYEDYGPEIEFPEFVDNYEYYVEKTYKAR